VKKKRLFSYATVCQRWRLQFGIWVALVIRQVNRKVYQSLGMAERSDRIHVRLQAFGDLL
jgi:hypothetical protein